MIKNIVNRIRSGESHSVKDALGHYSKDRKTIDRFKFIYYLSVINDALLQEVCFLLGSTHINVLFVPTADVHVIIMVIIHCRFRTGIVYY